MSKRHIRHTWPGSVWAASPQFRLFHSDKDQHTGPEFKAAPNRQASQCFCSHGFLHAHAHMHIHTNTHSQAHTLTLIFSAMISGSSHIDSTKKTWAGEKGRRKKLRQNLDFFQVFFCKRKKSNKPCSRFLWQSWGWPLCARWWCWWRRKPSRDKKISNRFFLD